MSEEVRYRQYLEQRAAESGGRDGLAVSVWTRAGVAGSACREVNCSCGRSCDCRG